MKYITTIILVSILFTSCEKVITLDLGKADNRIVIEGNITDLPGSYYIKISKTVSFSEASQYPPVNNAVVIITDNMGQNETLINTGNGIYKTNTLQGINGRTYMLNVTADGETYKAVSTMPQAVNLDSLLYRAIVFGGSTDNTVTPKFTDPTALGNNYHFVLKVNGVLDKTYFVDNDNVNDGSPYDRPLQSDDIEIESGNTVQVEMQCTDVQAYQYYFTLSAIQGMGPSSGTTPSNPPNGFSNGALGLFSAYTTQTKSIVIP